MNSNRKKSVLYRYMWREILRNYNGKRYGCWDYLLSMIRRTQSLLLVLLLLPFINFSNIIILIKNENLYNIMILYFPQFFSRFIMWWKNINKREHLILRYIARKTRPQIITFFCCIQSQPIFLFETLIVSHSEIFMDFS